MIDIDGKNGMRFVIGALLIAAVIISFLLVRAYLIPVLTSAVLAYLFYPVYAWLKAKIKKPNISAIILTIIIIIVIVVPTTFLLYHLSRKPQ